MEYLQNLEELTEDHEIYQIFAERIQLIENLQAEIKKLRDNLNNILQPFWQQIKNEIFDLKNQKKELDVRLQQLNNEYQKQTKHLENTQNELNNIKSAWYNQSAYITRLSSTFGTLLWKASKETNVVHSIATGDKITELFQFITNSIRTFFEIYGEKLPDSESSEKQFVITFVGIASNIAAFAEGRNIMVSSEEGRKFVCEVVKLLPRIPTNEVVLQKIILVTLYNVSIDATGLSLIENERNLLDYLLYNILNRNELLQVSMKILQSITYESISQNLIDYFTTAISATKLQESNYEVSVELEELIKKITENMKFSNKNFN